MPYWEDLGKFKAVACSPGYVVDGGRFALKHLELNLQDLPSRSAAPGLALWLMSPINAGSIEEALQGLCSPAGRFPKSGDTYVVSPRMNYEDSLKNGVEVMTPRLFFQSA